MKLFFFIPAFIISPFGLFAQSEKQISDWLYSLPIKENSIVIKQSLQNNSDFAEGERSLRNRSKHSDFIFGGKILKPQLPDIDHLDSSKVHLLFGNLKDKDNYSGNIKILKFEYFYKDTSFIHALFKLACLELKEGSIAEKPTGFRTLKDACVGKGTEFNYSISSKKLSKISITKAGYSDGKFSLQILYVGSTE